MKVSIIILLLFLYTLNINCREIKTIHLYVALCDNKNQGIVPVSKIVGNGQEPKNNLYWGAGYGIKTFFSKSPEWKLIKKITNPKTNILERLIFKHKNTSTYLLADAYDGAKIKNATIDFLNSAYGLNSETINIDSLDIQFGGSSNIIAYVGHDGLMDFTLDLKIKPLPDKKRETIILACASKQYFQNFILKSGAYPLLWTSNLMCPESYTLKAAIDGWVLNETPDQIRGRAAKAYSQYQKCSFSAAKRLLVTGW
jgi:hypothetical protein